MSSWLFTGLLLRGIDKVLQELGGNLSCGKQQESWLFTLSGRTIRKSGDGFCGISSLMCDWQPWSWSDSENLLQPGSGCVCSCFWLFHTNTAVKGERDVTKLLRAGCSASLWVKDDHSGYWSAIWNEGMKIHFYRAVNISPVRSWFCCCCVFSGTARNDGAVGKVCWSSLVQSCQWGCMCKRSHIWNPEIDVVVVCSACNLWRVVILNTLFMARDGRI